MSNFLQPHGLYSPWSSSGQNTGVSNLSLLQGVFPNQGSNPGLLHCRHILYQLSHKGSPPKRIKYLFYLSYVNCTLRNQIVDKRMFLFLKVFQWINKIIELLAPFCNPQ